MATKKRDNPYYLRRLQRDHPSIYMDLMARRIPSVRQAAAIAGLIHLPTRLDALKRAWRKADLTERKAFLGWVRIGLGGSTSGKIADTEGRLLLETKRRVQRIVGNRSIKLGQVMAEMGYKRLNPALGNALAQSTRLQPDMISALDSWLKRNAKFQ